MLDTSLPDRTAAMNEVVEFLLAQIAEDEAVARAAIKDSEGSLDWAADGDPTDIHIARWDPARVLAECEAKRAIIELHKSWPILVETQPEFTQADDDDPLSMSFRMTRKITWLIEREYRNRFATEPPTAPMILALATVYSDRPGYNQEWNE